MKTIHKYQIVVPSFGTDFEVLMPIGAEILTVQIQRAEPAMWALVETDRQIERRHFRIAITGQEFGPGKYRYINTFQTNDNRYVFHLFEMVKP